MKLIKYPVTLSNAPLKAIALIAGYTFWHIFGTLTTTTVSLTVPVCFYTTNTCTVIHGPETVTVQLHGKRAHLYALNTQSLAAHINSSALTPGKHAILLNSNNLFLPETIKLVHYMPSIIEITVQHT
jgi:YbbR domain-containing protein